MTVPKPPPRRKEPAIQKGDIVFFKLREASGVQVKKALDVCPEVVAFVSKRSSVVMRHAREDIIVYRVQKEWPESVDTIND